MSELESILEVNGFSFSIHGKPILQDVTFQVAQGEYISVVGPNAAGKSTLLKCLNKIHRGGSGEIRMLGKPLERYGQKELARVAGYVPQANGWRSPFTVAEFVMMGRYPYLNPFSPPARRDRDAVDEALALTGTTEFSDRSLNTLSGGEQQKVLIAAALAQETRILFLDEPTTFLDPKHEGEIQNILTHVNRGRGVTILSVTHDLNRAALMGGRIFALHRGSLAFTGQSAEFMQHQILKDIFDKSFLFVKHPHSDVHIVVPEGS